MKREGFFSGWMIEYLCRLRAEHNVTTKKQANNKQGTNSKRS
jgi:hypothetical protein